MPINLRKPEPIHRSTVSIISSINSQGTKLEYLAIDNNPIAVMGYSSEADKANAISCVQRIIDNSKNTGMALYSEIAETLMLGAAMTDAGVSAGDSEEIVLRIKLREGTVTNYGIIKRAKIYQGVESIEEITDTVYTESESESESVGSKSESESTGSESKNVGSAESTENCSRNSSDDTRISVIINYKENAVYTAGMDENSITNSVKLTKIANLEDLAAAVEYLPREVKRTMLLDRAKLYLTNEYNKRAERAREIAREIEKKVAERAIGEAIGEYGEMGEMGEYEEDYEDYEDYEE